jgi:S-DNA-T family DNA segregation ATPase FtsK/SpoIIIE
MAVSSAPLAEQGGIAGFFARRASELLGGVLILAALSLAVALLGHDANDPSLNHATTGPIGNPLGYFGASVADLSLQMFGYAAWVPVIVLPIWGLRLILGAPFDLSWWRIVALPPAILATAAYLGRPDERGDNPGDRAIRVAMVHDLETTDIALRRIAETLD